MIEIEIYNSAVLINGDMRRLINNFGLRRVGQCKKSYSRSTRRQRIGIQVSLQ
jgi:hypothetical protein